MSQPSSLDDAETGFGVQSAEPVSVSLHIPLLYLTPSTRASNFVPLPQILNIRQIPLWEKPLPPIPPRPVSKFVKVQPELPPPRKRLERRPSQWIQFQLWFNTYRWPKKLFSLPTSWITFFFSQKVLHFYRDLEYYIAYYNDFWSWDVSTQIY